METERLIITYPQLSSAKDFLEIQNSSFVQKYNCMRLITLEDANKIIKEDALSNKVFFLYTKEKQTFIGAVFFSDDDLRYGVNSLSLSYYLKESETKKGYMYEALQYLIHYMIYTYSLDVITCRIFKENIPSISLIEKLGFEYEGCLKHAVKATSGIIYDDCLYAYHKK